MAAGEARRAAETYGCPVAILDRKGRQKWYDIWNYCPDVLQSRLWREGLPHIVNGGKCRPYIDYERSTPTRWQFKPYKPIPARIAIPMQIRHWAEQYRGRVIIEPNIKISASPNKNWGWERWEQLVMYRRDLPWLQVSAGGADLPGVERVDCPSFIHAVALLSVAKCAVLPEGGLHHAAAAVGLPAVVLFGGYISPEVTGYDMHVNIYTGGNDLGCGNRQRCPHCLKAMAAITVSQVSDALDSILRKAA